MSTDMNNVLQPESLYSMLLVHSHKNIIFWCNANQVMVDMWLIWCVTLNLTSSLTLMVTLITPQWPTERIGFHHAIVYHHTYGQYCDL